MTTVASLEASIPGRNEPPALCLDSLDGLRGIAALWVMFFHCFIYSKLRLDFQGSSVMPLFFLLTGFTLTIVYNKLNPSPIELASNPSLRSNHKASIWSFYQNRAVRVLPVYYILNFAFALPYWYYGYGDADPVANMVAINASIGSTLTGTSTLFILLLGGSIDGPAWTVQTFLWLWLVFPASIRQARALPDYRLSSYIVYLYWTQLVLVFVLFFILLFILGFWPAFAAATMNPVTRYPLFLMGVYAGELCVRARRHQTPLQPLWPVGMFFPARAQDCCKTQQLIVPDVINADEAFWASRAVTQSILLLVITLAVAILDFGVGVGILGAVWLQAIVPFSQLELIMALTLERGESVVAHVLRTPLARWLGTISMTIYLVHHPVIWYLCWTINKGAAVQWPPANAPDSAYYTFMDQRTIPMWGVAVVPLITIPLACLVYYGYEEPLRKALAKK